jgi:hypothetical protein
MNKLLQLGMRIGSLTLQRWERYRVWAVCDCGTPWFGHTSQWSPGLRCGYEGHGLVSRPAPPARQPGPIATPAQPRKPRGNPYKWSPERKQEAARQREERLQRQVGRRFGSITVVGPSDRPGHVVVRCDCGTSKEKPVAQLFDAKSCGCLVTWKGMQRNGARSVAVVAESGVASSPARAVEPEPAVEPWRAELREQANNKACANLPAAPVVAPAPVSPDPGPELLTIDRAVLLAVQRSLASQGYPPSMGDLAEAVQTADRPFVPVADCLRRLELQGYIQRSHVSARGMRVLRPLKEDRSA